MALFFGKPKNLKCANCGATNLIKINKNIYKCGSCDEIWDFGFSDEERKLLDDAQRDLKRQEFDLAEEKFYEIISEYPENHEAYWGYVCARYGIKHEEDYDGRIIPTCCLDSIESFRSDKDFLKAVSLAPKEVSAYYIEEADYVERISKKWREEAEKEKPYDIFICFKDSDKEKGIDRTKDSYDAGDIYAWLTDKGYRVFFSRISLAGKTGDKYEPFIFSALRSAKVMLVFGSQADYFNSTWLKNEWKRYVKRISLGEKQENSLVVVYKDFDVSELPSLLSSRQCLDFSDNKFYYNLDGYLKKFFSSSQSRAAVLPSAQIKNSTVESSDEKAKIQFAPITAAKRKNKVFDALHIHDYSVTEIIPASCITRGYTIHRCECGDEYRDSMTPLAEHIFVKAETVDPTCEKGGKDIFVCSVCGDKDERPIPAKGHSFGDWIITVQPECEADGERAKQCSVCGKVITEKIEKTGHKFGNWVMNKRPTCLEKGVEIRQCVYCGNREAREVAATGHSFTEWKLSSDKKTETRYCKNCGEEESRKASASSSYTPGSPSASIGKAIKVGNLITFGTYSQGVNGEVKPIEWQVLDVENGKALVISKYALDCKPFNNEYTGVTWETSTLRKWLNNEFYNKAFSSADKEKIATTTVVAHKNPSYSTNQGRDTQDRVFLLSIKEAKEYFSSDKKRECKGTDYCYKQGAYKNKDNGGCWWWLRSSGHYSKSAAYVYYDGYVRSGGSVCYDGSLVDYGYGAVRPALIINL